MTLKSKYTNFRHCCFVKVGTKHSPFCKLFLQTSSLRSSDFWHKVLPLSRWFRRLVKESLFPAASAPQIKPHLGNNSIEVCKAMQYVQFNLELETTSCVSHSYSTIPIPTAVHWETNCQFVVNLSGGPQVLPVLVPDCPPPAMADLPCYIFDLSFGLLTCKYVNIKAKLANCTSHLLSCWSSSKWQVATEGGWRERWSGGATFSQTNQFCTGKDIFLMA